MSLKLNNDTANGSVTLQASNTATGDVVATLPPFSTELAPRMQLMTAKTASGTSVDFTSIPSWAKRITVMFNGVSTNGSSQVQIQLGNTTIQTTGYLGTAMSNAVGVATANHSSGFLTSPTTELGAMATRQGLMTLVLLGSNIWCCMSMIGLSNTNLNSQSSGSVTLSGTLDRIRITTANGTDTFDAGTINILVEG